MVVTSARKLLLLFILALLAPRCPAQDVAQEAAKDAAHDAKAPRTLLVAMQGASADSAAALEKSLALSLRDALPRVRLIEYGPADFPASMESRAGETARLGADCWLLVAITVDGAGWTLRVQSYDMLARTMTIDTSFTRTDAVDLLQAPHEHWEEIASLVRETYQEETAARMPRNERRTAKLLIHAQPDTSISGLPGGPLVASRYGVASADVDAPSSYRLHATLEGYVPADVEVYVPEDRDVQIVQKPSAAWSIDAGFFNALFFDVEAGWFFLPGTAFVRVGLTSFLVGLALNGDAVLYSFPLVHVNAQIGRYWGSEAAAFRPYTTFGGFIRIASLPGVPLRIDPLSPCGFTLGIGADILLAGTSRFFFEYVPMLYLSTYADLFVESIGGGRLPFGYVPLAIGALDFANVRFGIRWPL